MRPRTRSTIERGQEGFTILELTVVIGLLSVFMVFLLNVLLDTTSMFSDGQADQELSARRLAAVRPIDAALRDMVGPTREGKQRSSDARLLVRWQPIGLRQQGAVGEVQVLRATVRVDKRLEKELLAASFQAAAEELSGTDDPQDIAQAIAQMIEKKGLSGRAEMLLIPWPEGDAEGAYLEMRRGWSLPRGQMPFAGVEDPSQVKAAFVEAHTKVVATGLLHVSYRLASQYTENWIDGPGRGAKGPEWVWDSARVGLMAEEDPLERYFTLDLGEPSRLDSTDDVYPRYIQVTVVAGLSSQDQPESMLADDIADDERTIRLVNVDRLPSAIHGNFVKIGSEWVRFADLRGRELGGVRRGQRGTAARSHPRRTGVRVGKTQVMMFEVPHRRDSWNG